MNKLNQLLIILSLLLIKDLIGQELLIRNDSYIKDIQINSDGRLHLLFENKLCDFEGRQIANECLQLSKEIDFIVPIKDDYYAIVFENQLTIIQNNKIDHSDTLPELITKALLYQNSIFLGTAGNGLFQVKLSTNEKSFLGLKNEFINDLKVVNGSLIVALDNGLAKFDFPTSNFVRKELSGIVLNLSATLNNEIIAICSNGEMALLDKDLSIKSKASFDKLPIHQVSSSLNFTFILNNEGCYELDSTLHYKKIIDGKFQSILALPNNILLAQENNLFTFDLTVSRIDHGNAALSIFSENDTSLWVGSINKIEHFINEKCEKEISLTSDKKDVFVSALIVHNSQLIVGTMGEGIYVFNTNGELVKHLLDTKNSNRNNIIQLHEKDGIIWAAYLNGISKLNSRSFETEIDYDSLVGNNYVYCILPISADEFYIGTSSKGLIHVKENKTRTYLNESSVYNLYNGPLGLSIGTKENGSFILKDSIILPISVNISPRSISGMKDLLLFNMKNQINVVWKNSIIPISNGELRDAQLNSVAQNHHSIFVGYADGLLKYNKERLYSLTQMGLHLNQPKIFNKMIEEGKHAFKYNMNSFNFTFHTNSYYQISNTIYKYRLIGLDSTWQTTQQNNVNYYNLMPGDYTFEVASALTKNSKFINTQRYQFRIDKPYWKSTWFILLLILLITLIFYVGIKRREKRLLAKSEQEREKIKFELNQLKNQIDPHFLFNSLNSLIGMIEEDPKSAAKSTQLLSDLYRNILTYDKLDVIPIYKELELAKSYFEIHQIRFENLVELEINMHGNSSGKLIPLSCQFLIENAIKHNVINSENRMKIRIIRNDNFLMVSNTYQPKKANNHTTSKHGLENLKSRYKLLVNKPLEIKIENDLFIVKLPIIND